VSQELVEAFKNWNAAGRPEGPLLNAMTWAAQRAEQVTLPSGPDPVEVEVARMFQDEDMAALGYKKRTVHLRGGRNGRSLCGRWVRENDMILPHQLVDDANCQHCQKVDDAAAVVQYHSDMSAGVLTQALREVPQMGAGILTDPIAYKRWSRLANKAWRVDQDEPEAIRLVVAALRDAVANGRRLPVVRRRNLG
jgi:hypothetical protein